MSDEALQELEAGVDAWVWEPHILAAVDKAIFRQNFGGVRRPGRVSVKDGELYVDGERVPMAHRVSGYVQPSVDEDAAELVLLDADHHVRVDLRLPSKRHAEATLKALGLPVDRVAVPMTATWPVGAVAAYALLIVALSAALAAHETWWLAIAVALPLLLVAIVTMRASRHPFIIAPDGLVVERFGRREVIPYVSITKVEREGDSGLVLVLADGSKRRFTFEKTTAGFALRLNPAMHRDKGQGAHKNEAARDMIRAHVAARMSGAGERLGERLARGKRDVGRWLADVDRLARGDYRGEAPSAEQLWRVVEDGAAAPSARAAAARLLRIEGAARDRLRVVAGNTASPKLRIALEAMDADEEAQREALAELEA